MQMEIQILNTTKTALIENHH